MDNTIEGVADFIYEILMQSDFEDWVKLTHPLCEAVRDYDRRLRIGFPAIGLNPNFWKSSHY